MGSPDSFEVAAVDLARWFDADEAAKDAVANEVDIACRTTGFLAITGHGIPEQLLAEMLDTTQAFFDLPLSYKRQFVTGDMEGNRGYAAEGTEALSYSIGVESPPDLFEAFNVGPESSPRHLNDEERNTFFASNVWPTEPSTMRSVWLAYWEAVESLGETLLSILARALGLPDEWFQPFINEGPSVMRANNYQRRAGAPPPVEGQQRMGAHTDYGSLTILLADQVPGLQIRDSAGIWHDVLPPPGGFLVNLGDLLAEWTNDRWRSTLHRVVPPATETSGEVRRRSVAWFQQPNFDAMIEVLDVCCSPTNPARYQPISAGDHLIAKLMGPRTATVADVGSEFLHPE